MTDSPDYTTLLDKMLLDPKCKDFVMKMAECSMTSIASGKPRKNAKVPRGCTIFVPQNGMKALKGEKLHKALRSHIVSKVYEPSYIEKLCTTYKDDEGNSLESVTMRTMYSIMDGEDRLSRKISINCKDHKISLGNGKPSKIELPKPHLEAFNGVVYLIDKPLEFPEKLEKSKSVKKDSKKKDSTKKDSKKDKKKKK